MYVHPLFAEICDAHLRPQPYRLHDDAQWPDLPDVDVVQDEGGAVSVVHDLAERDRRILAEHEIAEAETLALLKRQLADTQDRLHDPFFPFFPVR